MNEPDPADIRRRLTRVTGRLTRAERVRVVARLIAGPAPRPVDDDRLRQIVRRRLVS